MFQVRSPNDEHEYVPASKPRAVQPRIELILDPAVHKSSIVPRQDEKSNVSTSFSSTFLPVEKESMVDLTNGGASVWKSGQEFHLDTALFRGKGCMFSRRHPETFPKDARYRDKESVIRVLGQFKDGIDLSEVFLGGSFREGAVRGLPHQSITNIGIQIARTKSPHFCIRATAKNKPFVAVPFLCLVDELVLLPLHGASAEKWQFYDLRPRLVEQWAQEMDDPMVFAKLRLNKHSSSAEQREQRQELRTAPLHRWPRFRVPPHVLVGFELMDSALALEDMVVKWKVLGMFTVSVPLKNYIRELPLGLFRVKRYIPNHRRSEKELRICQNCGSRKGMQSVAIPTAWQEQGLCDDCFPPYPSEKPDDFMFAVTVRNS